MTPARFTWVIVAAAAGFFSAFALASNPVSIDVVVTDAKQRPVQNLTAADFELTDSGEIRAVDDVRQPVSAGRTFAIFLDEYHVSAGADTDRVRAAVSRWIQTQWREGDRAAVMKPLDPLDSIALTSDRGEILTAINAFQGRKGNFAPRSTFEQNFISRDPATASVSRAQVVTSALQALAAKLGHENDGRKAIILLSEGFASPAARAIAVAANRRRVSIYSVDPSANTESAQDTLRQLSQQTGGLASINQSDLLPALSQSLADLDRYYLLTFSPAAQADGKFHPVEVRLKRAGSQTRARTGYWASNPSNDNAKPAAATMLTLPFRPARSSPYISPWVGMSRGIGPLTKVTVTWEPGAPPPRNQRVAAVLIKVSAADGQVLFQRRYGPGEVGLASFDAQPGYIALEMTLHSSTGGTLDSAYRSVAVPNLQVNRPTIATPQVFRALTARQFAEISRDGAAAPTGARAFSRAERLLIRVPVYGAAETIPAVTATLLNRRGTPMRQLIRVPAELPPGMLQFDLPLSSLAPDEYRVEVVAADDRSRDEAREVVVFRIIN
jgi:VWFA-related protein